MSLFRQQIFTRLFAATVVTAGLWVIFGHHLLRSETQKLRIRAGWLIAKEEYRDAETVVRSLLDIAPNDSWGRVFAGHLAVQRYDNDASRENFAAVIDEKNLIVAEHARLGLAEKLFNAGELKEAEIHLRWILDIHPANLIANRRMSQILYLQGRAWEARPYLEEQVRQGAFIADELVMLSSSEQWVTEDPLYQDQHPDNARLALGLAKIQLLKNLNMEARLKLERIVEIDPELAEAHAALGRTLYSLRDWDAFRNWKEGVRLHHLDHPEVWQVLATAAQDSGDRGETLRCCVAVLKRHPFHGLATYQLSQELSRAGEHELALKMLHRSRLIAQVSTLAGDLRRIADANMMRQVCEMQMELGRTLEAAGWADMARRVGPPQQWQSDILRTARSQNLTTHRIVPQLDEVEELASLWSRSFGSPVPEIVSPSSTDQMQFVDIAGDSGLTMQYEIGKNVEAGMEHIFETTGCGVAAVDYDLDTLPDLYFSQAGDWQQTPNANTPLDKLYRNRGNRFQNAASEAGIQEFGFSQGVTTGDLNEDGFSEIYVCNLGANSCYVNNGDGTFSEVAQKLGVSSDLWSLSAAIADLNGDNLSDVYVVNYLNKDEVAERVCKHEGQPRSCAPTMFAGAQDRLFLNDGSGHFIDGTEGSGIIQNDGKGLGLLVADFFNDGRLGLYIGNDTVANFLFVRADVNASGMPLFNEEAAIRGVAYNGNGQVQATMGMATADINGDKLLDIFTTNFYQDASTLYIQTRENYFEDRTRGADLYDSSFYMLGFGSQFIDTTRSGLLDLFVTNGHVDRTFATGEPDRMRPQMYRNLGTGQFEEITDGSCGSYFSQEMLGRAAAVLDWNNDGLQDIVVTHLDKPAALLENRSVNTNHFVNLSLIGVTCPRQPIGARVEVVLKSGHRISHQLVTGDGYQARNDWRLFAGIGADEISSLQIRWPDGSEETLTQIEGDSFITIVQGRGAFLLPSRQ